MVENIIQIKMEIKVNVDVNAKIRENIMCAKEIIFGIAVHVFSKKGNCLGYISGDSVIRCNEIMKTTKTFRTKTIPINFNLTKLTFKTENSYILVTFLLITISLLIIVTISLSIIVSIYCYIIKHQSKQKHYHIITLVAS